MTASPEVSTAIHGILDDWRSRHQHWSLMEVFLPSTQRHQSPALFSWYEVIESATFEIRDDAVAVAKLRWWRDELALAVEGRARHPLIQAWSVGIASSVESWRSVVDAALHLRVTAPRPANVSESWEAIAPIAEAQARLEHQLWGGTVNGTWRRVDLLLSRLRRHACSHAERSLLPLDLCARYALSVESVEPGSSEPSQLSWQLDWVSSMRTLMPVADSQRAKASALWSVATQLHLRALASPQQRQDIPLTRWVWHAWRAARCAAR